MQFWANSGFVVVSLDFKERLRFCFMDLMKKMAFRLKQCTRVHTSRCIKGQVFKGTNYLRMT